MTNEKIYKDFDLSLENHPVKKDLLVVLDEKAVNQAIRNILLTENYERGFEPSFGTPIYSLLFENMNVSTTIALRKAIEVALFNFEPRVSITQIEVNPVPERNYYEINIYYFIVNNPTEIFQTSLFLERIR